VFERLIRSAPALILGVLVCGASDVTLCGAETDPPVAGAADIELRKSFRSSRRASRQTARSQQRGGAAGDPGIPDEARALLPTPLGAAAAALGEQLQSSGTLHLPDVGGGGIVLQGSTTPILDTAAGRHLILDPDRTLDPGVVDGITRRWPGYSVVQPPVGADLREIIGSLLDAAGYDSVLRAAPLVFGRGITIRVTPDFVVLRSDRDLLSGETRAISVVDRAGALPPELRELAGQHLVRIVELTPDGAPAGTDRAPWRDPTGRVTTVEATRLAPIIEEIAGALGLSIERRVPLPAGAGGPGISADLRISLEERATLVLEQADPRVRENLVSRGHAAIMLNSAVDLSEAIGGLFGYFGIAAIGPAVEFYRAPTPGSSRRFVVNVPGWLVESGGRRLLITGASPPPLVRLYLTREGVDIFEYRVR
jgi:hypothetical protein